SPTQCCWRSGSTRSLPRWLRTGRAGGCRPAAWRPGKGRALVADGSSLGTSGHGVEVVLLPVRPTGLVVVVEGHLGGCFRPQSRNLKGGEADSDFPHHVRLDDDVVLLRDGRCDLLDRVLTQIQALAIERGQVA